MTSFTYSGLTVFGNVYDENGNVSQSGQKCTGIMIKGNGNYIIDGKEYKSDEITVRTEYKIKATGETVYTEPQNTKIEFHGDNASVSVSSSSGGIEIDCVKPCTFRSVQSQSGAIKVEGNVENVSNMSGEVSISGSVSGSVKTLTGSIRTKNR